MRILQSAQLVLALGAAAPALAGNFVPVCERTKPVRLFLESSEGVGKPCADISEADLVAVIRVAVPNDNIQELTVSDYSSLPNLETLNIKGNPFTTIPEGLLEQLPKLKVLVIFRTKLAQVPDNFLASNPDLEDLHIFSNPFTTLPEPVLQRLGYMTHLRTLDFNQQLDETHKERLRQLFPIGGTVELNFY